MGGLIPGRPLSLNWLPCMGQNGRVKNKCWRWRDSYRGGQCHLLTMTISHLPTPASTSFFKGNLLSLTTDPSPYLLGLLPFYNEGHNQPFFWLHPNNYLEFNYPMKCNCTTTLMTSTVRLFLLFTYNVRLADGEESALYGGQTLWQEPYFWPYLSHNFDHIWAIILTIFWVTLKPYFGPGNMATKQQKSESEKTKRNVDRMQ